MRIRGTDLEILAGSGESLTYKRIDRNYDDDGVLLSKVDGVFVTGDDVITFKVYLSVDDNTPLIQENATITDGKAVVSLVGLDTSVLSPNTYTYDVTWVHLSNDPVFLIPPSNFEIVGTSETVLGS